LSATILTPPQFLQMIFLQQKYLSTAKIQHPHGFLRMEDGMETMIKLKLWGHSQFQMEVNSSPSSMPMIPAAEPISPFNRRNPAPNNVRSQLKSRIFSATTTELPMIQRLIASLWNYSSMEKIRDLHGLLKMENGMEIMIKPHYTTRFRSQMEVNSSPSSMPMIPAAEPISPFSHQNPAPNNVRSQLKSRIFSATT